jgi:hypothetical protein
MSEHDNQVQLLGVIGRIGGDFLRTYIGATVRLVAAIARNIVNVWSGQGTIKAKIVYPVDWLLARLGHIPAAAKPVRPTTMPADIARLVTLLCAMVNEAHGKGVLEDDPARGTKVRAFLENLDFGELMEMVEGSDPYVLRAIETFNEELWKYPAKVGTLVATLIPLINIIIKSVREIMIPIEENIGPDLLADIILSLVKGINGEDTAKLMNTSLEVLNRIHTGSLLLGKGDKPLMQIYLTDVLKACLTRLDHKLMSKARIILSEDKLSIAQAVADAMKDNPLFISSNISTLGTVYSTAVKARTSKLKVIEGLEQESFRNALTESLSDVDTYEIAGLINTGCRVLNLVNTLKPGFLMDLVGGIVDSIDTKELGDVAQWLVTDLVQAVKPLSSTLMPVFIKALNEMLTPQAGFESCGQAEAIQDLKATLVKVAGGVQ